MKDDPRGETAWCRRFHPSPGAATRLVCLPHAGGSAPYFRPMSAALAPEVEVVSIQYPGRQDRRREPVIDDIRVLGDRLADILSEWDDVPTALFGHSMGALVGFEAIRRLEPCGRGPVRLFASGRRAPSCHRPENIHQMDDAGVLAEIREMSGTDPRLLDDDDLVQMVLPVLRVDYRAVESYLAEPDTVIDCPVNVLVGDSDPRTSLEEAQTWRRHTRGDFQMRVIPGGHFYLQDHPQTVIDEVRGQLQRSVGRMV